MHNLDPQTIVLIITTVVGTNAIPRLLRGLWTWATGHMRQQRAEVDRLEDRIDDLEALNRRLKEALHETRVVALDGGISSNKLPSFPA